MKSRNWCAAEIAALLLSGTILLQATAAPPQASIPKINAANASEKPRPAPAPVVNFKDAETGLLLAQSQIASDKFEEGLKNLQAVRRIAPRAMAARIAFVQRLAEIRAADPEQPKVVSDLTDALKHAIRANQTAACWLSALDMARAAVAAKSTSAGGLLDVLSKNPSSVSEFGPHLEAARLHMATGSAPGAEAELQRAAALAATAKDCAAWSEAVSELAELADGGYAPDAAVDLLERIRKSASTLSEKVDVDGRVRLKFQVPLLRHSY